MNKSQDKDTIELIKQVAELVKIKDPLFVAKVNTHGQIVIRDDVRKRNAIVPGDRVAVYHIEKVYE